MSRTLNDLRLRELAVLAGLLRPAQKLTTELRLFANLVALYCDTPAADRDPVEETAFENSIRSALVFTW